MALRSDTVEVVCVPAIGMKLTNLRRLAGREWLWRNDQIALAPGVPGTSYVETADSGGWDECFPTVGACPVPGHPEAPSLPDHGELWSARWESAVFEAAGGTVLTGTALGTRFPYEFHRELTLDRYEPVIHIRYRLRHLGDTPFPWIWSSHPLLNVQPGSSLELPSVRRVKIDAVHGRPDLSPGDSVEWPRDITGDTDAMTFPAPNGSGWAMKLFADIGTSGRAVLRDPRRGECLEFTMDPENVPQIGIWVNCAGWAPPGRRPYYNLALEPCIGAPDRLDQAASEWGTAQMLAPGAGRAWSVDIRLLETS